MWIDTRVGVLRVVEIRYTLVVMYMYMYVSWVLGCVAVRVCE